LAFIVKSVSTHLAVSHKTHETQLSEIKFNADACNVAITGVWAFIGGDRRRRN